LVCQLPQPNKQNKTKQFGWCGIIIGKKTTPPHHTDVITFEATSRQPRKLIFGMQPYSNPTRRNMEDDLTIFENGRRISKKFKGRRAQLFSKWKMTSTK
jgi:hypothetical protein